MGSGGWGGRRQRGPGGKAAGYHNPSIRLFGKGQQQVPQRNPGYILVTSSEDTQAGMWPGSHFITLHPLSL